jgi:hypothetical protein
MLQRPGFIFISRQWDYDSVISLKNTSARKIKAGGSRKLKLTYRLLPGLSASGKFIIAVIGPTSSVPERDESNNQIVFGPIP